MLKQRLVTAFFLLLIMGWMLFFSTSLQWLLFVSFIALVSLWEWSGLAGFSLLQSFLYMLSSLSLILIGSHFKESFFPFAHWLNIVAIVFWCLAVPFWLKNHWQLKNKVIMAFLGWLLVFSTMLSLVLVKQFGALELLALFSVIWLSDSAAYFVGRALGKNKLAPSISPGKTWEGVLGAVFVVGLYGLTLEQQWVFNQLHLVRWAMSHGQVFFLMLLIIVIMGIIGDLFESWLKRCVGLKDSGYILPGHGGILDRIDALMATLPIMAIWIESIK